MRNMKVIFGFVLSTMLLGCTTTVPYNLKYAGKTYETGLIRTGCVDVETKVFRADGVPTDKGFRGMMDRVMTDALGRNGFNACTEGEKGYVLETHLKLLPGYDFWGVKENKLKTFGLAMIPFAGAFTDIYYDISTGFQIDFELTKDGKTIFNDGKTLKETKEIGVSPLNAQKAAIKQAIHLWESERDQAIGTFFADLEKTFPPKNKISAKSMVKVQQP